jgi:hypothetical protein
VARVLNDPVLGQAIDGPPSLGVGQGPSPLLSPGEQAILAQAPTLGDRRTSLVRDAIGKVWNGPNTVIGAIYGGLGMGAGEIAHVFAGAPEPRVRWRNNALEFTNNPSATGGAITIGNTTIYEDDPYSPAGRQHWGETERREGHPVWEHEKQHTLQGQQFGPFYLPSNLVGGLTALTFDRDPAGRPDWHGPHNWNEAGPQLNPARPWAR